MPFVDLSLDKINRLIAETENIIGVFERLLIRQIGTVGINDADIAATRSKIQLAQRILRKLQRSAENAQTGVRAGREGNARRRKTRKNRRT